MINRLVVENFYKVPFIRSLFLFFFISFFFEVSFSSWFLENVIIHYSVRLSNVEFRKGWLRFSRVSWMGAPRLVRPWKATVSGFCATHFLTLKYCFTNSLLNFYFALKIILYSILSIGFAIWLLWRIWKNKAYGISLWKANISRSHFRFSK